MIPSEGLRPSRRILAIDAGTGTQDILVYEEGSNPENSIKMVLPAMTQVLAGRIREVEGDLFLHGETMGGGPVSFAIKEHLAKGYKVSMTEQAARTISDHLQEVREEGIEIISGEAEDGQATIDLMDIDLSIIRDVLLKVGRPFDFDYVGIAVQDHGYAEGTSDRVFRFQGFKEMVDSGARLEDLMYIDPPQHFTRMHGALRTIKKEFSCPVFVMDTKVAAIAGAVLNSDEKGPVLAVDIGNGHTTGALVDEGGRVQGLYEHHTSLLDREKLESHLLGFLDGTLDNEDILTDGGHGCFIKDPVLLEKVGCVLVTGPKRSLLGNALSSRVIQFPSPYGDVMMTGTAGIAEMILKRVEGG